MLNPPFKSRRGLVQNLKKQLLSGRSAVMIGGPMIGKTTLAHDLSEEILDTKNRAILISLKEMKTTSDFWALLMEAILKQGISPETKNPFRKSPDSFMKLMSQLHHIYEKTSDEVNSRKLILLIDDCDRFLPDETALISQTLNMAMELLLPAIDAICWIGGLEWSDWVDGHSKDFLMPLRFYPLSVVPIREAREIISEKLGPSAFSQVWRETGGHPFLMSQAFGETSLAGLKTLNEKLTQLVKAEEIQILDQLDSGGQWMILENLKERDGKNPQKKRLDRLCMMGVIVRTLNDGTAVVRKTAEVFQYRS